MLTILTHPNQHLKIVCKPVTDFGTHLMPSVQNMVATMIAKGGIGLAANQVGLTERIFVMEVGDTFQEYINPEIIESSDPFASNEGCLSFPGVHASVQRFGKIKIKAKSFMGNDIEQELTGRDAVCFQHEIDHLDGKVFLDYLGPVKRAMVNKKFLKLQK